MQGYKRDIAVTWRLITALERALIENPEMRLGQLLMNLTTYDLWEVHDEEWIALLTKDTDDAS